MPKKILVIDDEETLTEMLVKDLQPKGFDVVTASSGHEGLIKAQAEQPDLIILDIMMPYLDGFDTCKRIRTITSVPILILTAKTSEEDLVHGFEAGADDYLKKPFSLRELHVRLEALLKRAGTRPLRRLVVFDDGNLKIDVSQNMVFRKGRLVHMTPTEHRLLFYLVTRKGRVATHEELLREVWGNAYIDAVSYLAIYIRYLREKLEDDPKNPFYIHTQWGVGYRFSPGIGEAKNNAKTEPSSGGAEGGR